MILSDFEGPAPVASL